MLALMYAVVAFYMPMALMALVVTKKFGKAVNPAFIFRSISRISGEYLTAMTAIFSLLALATALLNAPAVDSLGPLIRNIVLPVVWFYAAALAMRVSGLLYYRNGDKLKW
jgi:hypothetical protein